MQRDNYSNKFRLDKTFLFEPLKINDCLLYQVGDIYCDEETLIHSHYQEVFEISFIDSGSGLFYTNDVPTKLKEGYLYFSFTGDIHSIKLDSKDFLRFYYIAFEYPENHNMNQMLNYLKQAYNSPDKRAVKAKNAFPFMQVILSEIKNEKAFYQDLIESTIRQMIIYLYRLSLNDQDQSSFYTINTKNQLLHNITRFIDDNILNIKGMKSITDKFPFDSSYLSSIFKKFTGLSLHQYLIKKRMEQAHILLINKNKSVKEVAEVLNYTSANNFSRAFKLYYNLYPIDYIKKYKYKED